MTDEHRPHARRKRASNLVSFRNHDVSTRPYSHLFSLAPVKSIRLKFRRPDLNNQFDQLEDSDDAESQRPSSTIPDSGLWKNQMLVDRSLWIMAFTTTVFALIMLIVVFAYSPRFFQRTIRNSSSIFAGTKDCKTAGDISVVLHLFVNIAATMILGMSNTYQQLITAIDINDIPKMLRKTGDCRIGTNSPWAINQKSKGKITAWISWIFLICTSLPVHLLANSFIGLSYIIPAPEIEFVPMTNWHTTDTITPFVKSFRCLTAFSTGQDWWPSTTPPQDFKTALDVNEVTLQDQFPSDIVVFYDEAKCSSQRGSSSHFNLLLDQFNHKVFSDGIEQCSRGFDYRCDRKLRKVECRISIRMQAAVILAMTLTMMAGYMLIWNFYRHERRKTKCLTFGDVIAAAYINSELQVRNECLVNVADACRKEVKHTCHPKHCRTKEVSRTGDDLDHCQKCKKMNKVNNAAGLEHPVIATKYKKSLITNLAGTALTQIILLSFCSFFMIAASIMVAIKTIQDQKDSVSDCYYNRMSENHDDCLRRTATLKIVSGGWGGIDEGIRLVMLPPNSFFNEIMAFVISNGAQLTGVRSRKEGTVFGVLYIRVKDSVNPIHYSCQVLGQAVSAREWNWTLNGVRAIGIPPKHATQYEINYAAYPLWLATVLMVAMTVGCWRAFSFSREGFMPQMYGSIRVCCASTTSLTRIPAEGIQWGDLGTGTRFRHAGFSDLAVGKIIPGELYCGDGKEYDLDGPRTGDSIQKSSRPNN